jgi:hypothetical protein
VSKFPHICTPIGEDTARTLLISCQNAKGEWQEPLNLGGVKTSREDMCWAFTPDGKRFTAPGAKAATNGAALGREG